MNRNIEVCPCCNQKIVTYKHKLNKGLCNALWKLHKAGGVGKLKELNLTNNEFGNFQKLAYFGLVFKKTSNWYITSKGIDFITGEGKAPEAVYTKNNVIIGEDIEIYKYQVKGYYEGKEEWQEQARRW